MSVKVLLILSLGVGGCLAFGGPPGAMQSPPMPAEPAPYDTDHFYPCFTSMICILKETEDYAKLKECASVMNDEDFSVGLKWMVEDAKTSDYEDIYDAVEENYCPLIPKARKKKFDNIIEGVMQVYSLGCDNKHPKQVCEHWEQITECTIDLLEAMRQEKKCDTTEFDKQFD